MGVDIQLVFDTTLIICKDGVLFIFIIIINLKCWTWSFYRLNILFFSYLKRIVIFITIWSSYESPFILNEIGNIFCVSVILIGAIFSSKSTDSHIKSIHGSRHWVDEFRLAAVDEAVYFVCVFFNLVSTFYQFRIRLVLFSSVWTLGIDFAWSGSFVTFLVAIAFVVTQMNSLGVLKLFDLKPVFNPVTQRLMIIRKSCVLGLRRLFDCCQTCFLWNIFKSILEAWSSHITWNFGSLLRWDIAWRHFSIVFVFF